MTSLQPVAHVASLLSILDYGIIAGSCVLVFFIGEIAKRRTNSADLYDYFLMSRRLSLPLFVFSLVATWYGGIFGVTKMAFENGLYAWFTQGVFWYLTYIFFAVWLVPKIHQLREVHPTWYSLPSMLNDLVGPRSAKCAACFNFVDVVPTSYIVSLGLLGSILFGGTGLWCIVLFSVLILFYSSRGGFRAIVYTDALQFGLMVMSLLVIFGASLFYFGSPFTFLKENLPREHLSPAGSGSVWEFLSWGGIAFATLVDPNFHGRVFAASSEKVSKRGILIATVIWATLDLMITVSALYARAAIPEADPSQAFFVYSLQILPSGLRGVFISGMLALILSTLDSYLFTATKMLHLHLLPMKGKLSKGYLQAVILVMAFVIGHLFDQNLKSIWKFFGSLNACALLIPFVLLMKGWKISDRGFVTTVFATSLGLVVYRFFLFREDLDVFYVGCWLSLSCFILVWIWEKRDSSEEFSGVTGRS